MFPLSFGPDCSSDPRITDLSSRYRHSNCIRSTLSLRHFLCDHCGFPSFGAGRLKDPATLQPASQGNAHSLQRKNNGNPVMAKPVTQMAVEADSIAESPDESARIVVPELENRQRLEPLVTLSDLYATGQHSPDGLCLRGR